MIVVLKPFVGWLSGLFRSHAAHEAEVVFLRQQLVVLKRSALARLRTADRRIAIWLCRVPPSLLEAAVIFKPEARVRWHRSGFRLYWCWKSRCRVGRPAVPGEMHDFVRTITPDNPLWGAPRILTRWNLFSFSLAASIQTATILIVAPQLGYLTSPVVRTGAGFQRNNAGRLYCHPSSFVRVRRLRNSTLPVASAPCAWNTCFAISNPIMVACSMDASLR
jgi:hypothetical protein